MITGYFDSALGPQPYLRAAVKIEPLVSRWRFIDFLIDMGASLTIVHPHDSLFRLMLPQTLLGNPTAWPNVHDVRGLGGDTRLFQVPAQLGFLDGDELREFQLPISIAQLTAHNRDIPSLLGWDILGSMDIRISRSRGSVELEFGGP